MRQQADKLEKGKWYCDLRKSNYVEPSFLRFIGFEGEKQVFGEQKNSF